VSSKGAKEKKARKPVKVEEVKESHLMAMVETGLPSDLINKARVELVKEKFLTPFRVAQRYGVKISTARRLLRILAEEGLLVLVAGNRRSRVYVARKG
jgi:small subunit ribosomal protein S25e